MRRAVAVAAVFALALAGCGDTSQMRSGGKVSGDTLAVYIVLPLNGQLRESSRQIVEGAKLALYEARGRAGEFEVSFAAIDEGRDGPLEGARAALRDPQTIAVIGAGSTRAARQMVPLLEAAGVALISPAALDPAIARDARFHPARQRFFRPLVGDDRAQVEQMLEVATGPVAIESDGTETGRRLAAEAAEALERAGRRTSGSRRTTLLFLGEDLQTAAEVINRAIGEGRHRSAIVPDQLARRGLASHLEGPARERVLLLHAAPSLRLAPAGFVRSFGARFGRDPGRYALLGHRAMRAVLEGIARAGPMGDSRGAVARELQGQRRPEPFHGNAPADDEDR